MQLKEPEYNSSAIDSIYKILKLEGFSCNFSNSWSGWKKLSYHLFGAANFSLLLCATIAEMVGVHKQLLAKEYEFASMTLLTAAVAVLFLAYLFASSADDLHEINVMIKDIAKFSFEYSPAVARKDFGRYWYHAHYCLRFQMIIHVTTLFLWSAVPYYDYYRDYPFVKYEEIRLTFATVTFGLDKASHFWLINYIQMIPGATIVITLAVGYALPLVLCTLVQGQIVILTNSIRKIPLHESGCDFTRVHGFNLRSLSFHDFKKPRKSVKRELTSLEVQLKDCIIHHQLIYRLTEKIKSVLAPFIFINVFCIIVGFANLAIAAASDSRTSNHPRPLVVINSFSLLMQLNIVASYVVHLREAYSQVGFVAYSIYHSETSNGKDLLTVIARANREEKFPCILSSSFTFRSVLTIMELSWNYFILCDSVVEKHNYINNKLINETPPAI